MVQPLVMTKDKPLYPEEAVRQQKEIDAQVRQIDEERFQVATEKTKEEAIAATKAAETKAIYDGQIKKLTVTEEDYQMHVNQDEVDDGQIGAIIAAIIGGILLVVLAVYLLMKMMKMRQAKNGRKLVGQSSFRSDSQTPNEV